MSNVNLNYNDRVRYTLKCKDLDPLITTEPIGWKDDEKEYARHEVYHGIVAKFSNSIKFIDTGAEYIELVKDVYGINGQIELIREEKHPQTDVWTLTYSGYLDMSTYLRENNQVSIKFNSGGLEQLLKAREAEKVELDRETTIDGKPIGPLKPKIVDLEGRRIFLKTKFECKASDNLTANLVNYTSGFIRGSSISVPLKLANKSHECAQEPIDDTLVLDDTGHGTPGGGTYYPRSGSGQTGEMFFAVNDKIRHLRVRFNIKFKVNIQDYDDADYGYFWFRLVTYKDGINYTYKEDVTFFHTESFDDSGLQGRSFNFNFDQNITLLEGESLGLIFDQLFKGSSEFVNSHLNILINNIECELFIEEDSFAEPTKTKAVLAYELVDRLITIATGKENALYSEYLGRIDSEDVNGNIISYTENGTEARYLAVAHGFWIRQFDKLPIPAEATITTPKIENMFKPLTTSFKDALSSLDAVLGIGIGIEKIGKKEIIRLEPLSHFYNRNVTIKLGQVKNVKRGYALDKYYSSIDIGYELGGKYEEVNGLDEYNGKSNFTTVINRLKNVFSKISNYRADSYGMEFARRKPRLANETLDTNYDTDIWFIDTKRSPGNLQQRKWQDDFDIEPTGIFSPDTATNLRLSPFNSLLRHSWWFSGCLKNYASDYIRYGSSTANSFLKTKLKQASGGNGHEYSENGTIINSELKAPRFIADEIEFEYECDFDVMQQVNGSSTILGKTIPNFYGLVEFTNEKSEIERCFLMNLKPNGKGQWKGLIANR